MTHFVEGIVFVTETCCACHVPFAMTRELQKKRLNDRKAFYCPNGHAQHYAGRSEEQRLRDRLAQQERETSAARMQAAEAEAEARRVGRSNRRMRTRIANGTCPCCNRHFPNVLAHMQTKHPSFGKADSLRTARELFGLTQADVAREIGYSAPVVSNFERGRRVSVEVEEAVINWLDRHAAQEAP